MTSSTNTLGKYQIIREIARSNDIVYEAIDPTINRRIALKELYLAPNLQGAQKRERIERFWREGKAAGRLSHPNIVTIFEVGKDGDRHFIAMEYLEGQTLRDTIQAGGAMSIKDVKNYMLQLCSALAYAHQNGIIHRDIKPENVQILPGGHVKLTDFGIARMMGEPGITQDGQVFGTPSYMSPEQVAGKELDARSDIFSMGVLLFEMVAGKKPFVGDSIVTITYNIMHMDAPAPPGAPPFIVNIIRKAMAKDPDMRYSSADEMAQDLRDENANGFAGYNGYGSYGAQQTPDPFGGPVPMSGGAPNSGGMNQQLGQLTPYGTPMPSPNAGAPQGSIPDPFAQLPVSAPLPPPPPPRPIMSAETRNFLGIFLVVIGVAGMIIFAIWALNFAYDNYKTATTADAASNYYEQGMKLYQASRLEDAVEQWRQAIRVSPKSKPADNAREMIFQVSVKQAADCYVSRNADSLKSYAEGLIEAKPDRPEGHFYLAAACSMGLDPDKAKAEYAKAIECGGNDSYAQEARKQLGWIYMSEGDQLRSAGKNTEAVAAYEKAKEYGDVATMQQAQEKIEQVK